jgi:hypothetical protein
MVSKYRRPRMQYRTAFKNHLKNKAKSEMASPFSYSIAELVILAWLEYS